VLDFVEQQVYAAARPEGVAGGLGREVTLRRAIEAALPSLDKGFHHQPLIEARLRLTLGSVFLSLGERKIALDQYQAAQTLYSMNRGPDHPDTLRSKSRVASAYLATDRIAEAAALLEGTLSLMRARLGPDDGDTLWSADLLATCYSHLGRDAEALRLREETLALREAKLGRDHRDTLRSMGALAASYFWLGRREDCLTLRKKILALQKDKLGPSDPGTLGTMDALAFSYYSAGRDAEALPLFEESLALREDKFGPQDSRTVWSMVNLAELLATASDVSLRDPPRALELAKKAVDATQDPTNPSRGTHVEALATRGIAHYRTGDWNGAAADLEKAIGLRTPDLAQNSAANNTCNGFYLAMAYWQLGDKERARQWFARSVKWMEEGKVDFAVVKRSRAEAAALLGVGKTD
jgi:tetratricopeptide (TPR) repeat protein